MKSVGSICLATAASFATEKHTAVGEPEGGYFFLQPWPLWAAWKRAEINLLRRADKAPSVCIDGVKFSGEMKLT